MRNLVSIHKKFYSLYISEILILVIFFLFLLSAFKYLHTWKIPTIFLTTFIKNLYNSKIFWVILSAKIRENGWKLWTSTYLIHWFIIEWVSRFTEKSWGIQLLLLKFLLTVKEHHLLSFLLELFFKFDLFSYINIHFLTHCCIDDFLMSGCRSSRNHPKSLVFHCTWFMSDSRCLQMCLCLINFI